MPTIYVDADACPVKDEVTRVAERHGLPVVFVSNGGLRPSRDPMVRHVVVPGKADAADDWIVQHATEGDIAVTADVPLAARLVEKELQVLGPTGRTFTRETIGMDVAMRNLKQDLRESGEIKGFNPGFSQKDRSAFLQAFDAAVRRAMRAADRLEWWLAPSSGAGRCDDA
ncbi:YaiI/YqxD family protein [Chelativorans sp.]|uniref:YaiI/YqxD family protein n=1 Tax=Chelativorans sp. TaxID=2203393 RepID=UPI002811561D|nr:YaiI/YqxD family protein [Chelativorans sp.]